MGFYGIRSLILNSLVSILKINSSSSFIGVIKEIGSSLICSSKPEELMPITLLSLMTGPPLAPLLILIEVW